MGLIASPAVIMRILDLMHEALCDNVIVSKRCPSRWNSIWVRILLTFRYRNIYYKDPVLFKTQLTVDYYVDIIAYTFGVSRLALNVVGGERQPSLRASLIFL